MSFSLAKACAENALSFRHWSTMSAMSLYLLFDWEAHMLRRPPDSDSVWIQVTPSERTKVTLIDMTVCLVYLMLSKGR